MTVRDKTPNERLRTLMVEARMSNTGLANRMKAATRNDDKPLRTSHTNIAKYLSGATATIEPRTAGVMQAVFSES